MGDIHFEVKREFYTVYPQLLEKTAQKLLHKYRWRGAKFDGSTEVFHVPDGMDHQVSNRRTDSGLAKSLI